MSGGKRKKSVATRKPKAKAKAPNLHLYLQTKVHLLLHKKNLRLLLMLWPMHGPR